MTTVPDIRIQIPHPAPARPDGEYILYWMIAFRRLGWNFALEQAAGWARELGKPLVILEPLRAGYPWASDRFHRFVIDGMAGHARCLAKSRVLYHPYVEPEPGAGKGLLEALARRSCVVVTDDYPAFFLPRMVDAAAKSLSEAGVRLEKVDSNGLLPLRAAGRTFSAAYHFRRFLQKELPHHLGDMPAADPLKRLPPRLESLPKEVLRRWPAASADLLEGKPEALAMLAALPIDHSVPPVPGVSGGDAAGADDLQRFLDERLERYGEGRNHPIEDITSRLSPHLHFGTVSAHQMLAAVAEREDWTPDRLSDRSSGKREGWWGMSPSAEKFLDEAITWREIGFNLASQRPDDYDRYESLPDWAQETLRRHAPDPRPHLYTLEQFEAGETADELWNAAQGQLREEGRIHNYLRMLWGKKVLHWSKTPQEALANLIHLNNKYALDGRDPNSYSGIFWCFGRFDRPWAPERPVFGSVRYMSTESTRRKLKVNAYVERYASPTT